MEKQNFEVIIIGGSYSGLSAAMALGRSLRHVLVIDSGLPCNRQTLHSHNFLTQDGETPAGIWAKAKLQVENYKTVHFYKGLAVEAVKIKSGFKIITESGKVFTSKKILFATGVKDLLPEIKGLAECWGISILHCPYCHGYEMKGEKTAIVANGEMGFEYAKMISNWTKDLRLLTNGKSTLTLEQTEVVKKHNIEIIESELAYFEHENGIVQQIVFKDESKIDVRAVYYRPAMEQHCPLPEDLGCDLNENGLIQVDFMQKTTIDGVYASGDCTTQMRSVAFAVSTGSFAGIAINSALISENFS